MRRVLPLLVCMTLATPLHADDGEIGKGVDLLGEGARTLLRGLIDRVDPAMRDLAEQLGALNWQGLGIEDLDDYQAPEVLPNGDIILRRKPDAPAAPAPGDDVTPLPGDEIEI
ncbi:AAA+ family ATPase [Oceaniglobus indicus]|uniref:AAA+ family ATPase n=1 Tax=Oceaniglobus indicus TaxID=2047749 RepID=UPI001F4D83D7|nr:AAA+ family ATPase [Oceaniglobus indicus]